MLLIHFSSRPLFSELPKELKIPVKDHHIKAQDPEGFKGFSGSRTRTQPPPVLHSLRISPLFRPPEKLEIPLKHQTQDAECFQGFSGPRTRTQPSAASHPLRIYSDLPTNLGSHKSGRTTRPQRNSSGQSTEQGGPAQGHTK